MAAKLLQPTLTAGEVSPSLHGRVDINRYATGLKRCRNWIVRPYGGVENRPGFRYVATAPTTGLNRVIPFVFSDGVSYVLVFGHNVVRFISSGAEVTPAAVAWSAVTTYGTGAYALGGPGGTTIFRSLQGANLNHQPDPAGGTTAWWIPDAGLQLGSPYPGTALSQLRYTQSADVLYITHPDYEPRELRRLTANSFEFALHEHREGPFLDLNVNESLKVASSSAQGTATITSTDDLFTSSKVGNLLYLETKNLGQVKPWVVGDRSVTSGAQRRSDGKTYTAVTVPTGGTWTETGPRQPVHENGRAWDGSGETKTNGTDTWSVGIEWEYTDSGFGVVKILTVVDARTATAQVMKKLPLQVVGGVGGPANTWGPFVGDGVTTAFSIPAAGYGVYSVTIDGVGWQPDPNYTPPAPVGGGFDGNNTSINTL
jgi:hypothetical protein